MIRTWILASVILVLAPVGWAQTPEMASHDDQIRLQLQIHTRAQELRQQRDQLKAFIIETHVRSSRLDIAQKLRASGFIDDDIRDMLDRPGFVDLFERIRTNKVLEQKVDTYLDQYLEPHHIEEQVMAKHQRLAEHWLELTKAQRMAAALQKQRMIRTLQDKEVPKPMTFWQKLTQKWFGSSAR